MPGALSEGMSAASVAVPEKKSISAKSASSVRSCAALQSTAAASFPFSFSFTLPSVVLFRSSLNAAPKPVNSSKLSFPLVPLKGTDGWRLRIRFTSRRELRQRFGWCH